jgi:uncharacterized membrane protein YgdD (TMEM256/DUF423 family)
MTSNRLFVAIAGLCGAAGVGFAAVGAHGGAANTATAASFLIMHAPAFLVLGRADSGRVARIGGSILLAGLALFAGDLLARDQFGDRLFALAAPAGGMLMITGWLGIAAAALLDRRP